MSCNLNLSIIIPLPLPNYLDCLWIWKTIYRIHPTGRELISLHVGYNVHSETSTWCGSSDRHQSDWLAQSTSDVWSDTIRHRPQTSHNILVRRQVEVSCAWWCIEDLLCWKVANSMTLPPSNRNWNNVLQEHKQKAKSPSVEIEERNMFSTAVLWLCLVFEWVLVNNLENSGVTV
jgi:hypothetical protein